MFCFFLKEGIGTCAYVFTEPQQNVTEKYRKEHYSVYSNLMLPKTKEVYFLSDFTKEL